MRYMHTETVMTLKVGIHNAFTIKAGTFSQQLSYRKEKKIRHWS